MTCVVAGSFHHSIGARGRKPTTPVRDPDSNSDSVSDSDSDSASLLGAPYALLRIPRPTGPGRR